MRADADPAFHFERYKHLPEILVDGVRKIFCFKSFRFEKK